MTISISSLTKAFQNAIVATGLTGTGGVASVGSTVNIASNKTRPANTTAYAINGVISDSTTAGTPFVFVGAAAVNGGSGYVTKVLLQTDNKTFASATRLHLFNAPPTIAHNDGALFPNLWVDKDSYQGYIDLDTSSAEDATASTAAKAINKDIRLAFTCAAGAKDLYGILQVKVATSSVTSGQNFNIRFTIEQT